MPAYTPKFPTNDNGDRFAATASCYFPLTLVDASGFLCDIMRHIPTATGWEGKMSVRKREWTTNQGEEREAWIVDYADQDGDRHIRTFAKKKDADAYHDTVRVDV